MDYEKEYKEALEKAKIFKKHLLEINDKGYAEEMDYIFPELKESEDERIRKEIINYFKCQSRDEPSREHIHNKWIAWLEKQQEPEPEKDFGDFIEELHKQFPEVSFAKLSRIAVRVKKWTEKHTDKIEPKFDFYIGQWIVATGKCVYLITKIDGFNVTLVDTNGEHYVFDVSSLEDAHQWTIQDAKDGDVLVASDGSIFIYAGLSNEYAKCYIALYTHNEYSGLTDFSEPQNWEDKNYVHPATKEQCELLFAKMKESGYKWDAEKKQVIKL